jgi:thymidine kinase
MNPGTLEIIAGCMFSDKTSSLIRILKRGKYEQKTVAAVKPTKDARYSEINITSHEGVFIAAVPVTKPEEILQIPEIMSADIVGVDEGQFFESSIVDVCLTLVNQGKRVIVAGLDQDSAGRSFGSIPELMAQADFVQKLHAACVVCGARASKTQRLIADTSQVLVGGAESYDARCRKHWHPL